MIPVIDGCRSYSTAEIARRLGISPQTVQRWVDSGRLLAWKTPGGHRRIDARSADRLIAEQGERLAPIAAAAAAGAVRRVLVVHGDPSEAEAMASIAAGAWPDAQVQLAACGFEALVLRGRWSPEVVIVDVGMRHMDGVEWVRSLFADPAARPRLAVAMWSGGPEVSARVASLPLEVRLLRAPIHRERIVDLLRHCVGASRADASAPDAP